MAVSPLLWTDVSVSKEAADAAPLQDKAEMMAARETATAEFARCSVRQEQ